MIKVLVDLVYGERYSALGRRVVHLAVCQRQGEMKSKRVSKKAHTLVCKSLTTKIQPDGRLQMKSEARVALKQGCGWASRLRGVLSGSDNPKPECEGEKRATFQGVWRAALETSGNGVKTS